MGSEMCIRDRFWVNKLSGESTWQKPPILMEQESIIARKRARAMDKAPSLEDFLYGIFATAGESAAAAITLEDFWMVVTDGLKIHPGLTDEEVLHLKHDTDLNHDGLVDWNEFVTALAPKLQSTFGARQDHNQWVALDTDYYLDGKKYMYWYNRTTGETSWDAPERS